MGLPMRQTGLLESVWHWWNVALLSPYFGSRECPSLLNKLEDPARVRFGGPENLAKGDRSSVVVDSRRRALPCVSVAPVGDMLGGA